MRPPMLTTLLACLVLALAFPATAHHGQGGHETPPDDPEEPCACDPGEPGPVEVVVGDGFECVGGSSGSLTVDGGAARVTVHYCKPWWEPVLLP